MEERLPQGRNLLKQLDLKGDDPRTATHPESVEESVIGDGGGEAAVQNHRHRLTNHLYEAYNTILPSPFRDQNHGLPGRLLYNDPISER